MKDLVYDLYLELRLKDWGEWIAGKDSSEQGYKPCSTVATYIGIRPQSNNKARNPSYVNESILEMNALIDRMSQRFPAYADALKMWYTPTGQKSRDLEIRTQALRLGISVTTLKERKNSAKAWLSGRFDAEIDTKKNFKNSLKDSPNIHLTSRPVFA
jgi:hypothetical protein